MSIRRPSMAERRSSMTQEGSLRPPVVPHLAGLEKPLPETVPEACDVVIAGTGLTESILAAALAWQGSSVLHIDANDYYGDTTATLTIDQLKTWVERVNKGEIKGYQDAVLYIPRGNEFKSKDFGIDLTPKVLFCKSDLLSLLVTARVYKYLEFLPLSSFHFFENDNFEKMTSTKQDIFTNQTLSLATKRSLMKFIKFSLDWESHSDVWSPYKDASIETFLQEQFKLEKAQIFELIFSIGLCNNNETHTPEALARIKRYLISYDVYGNFPVMYSKYGGAGEISQGFCRSAAVAGATYKLNTKLVSFDPKTKIAQLSDNSCVKINEQIIISPSQAPTDSKFLSKQNYEIQRLTVIVKKDCTQWFHDNESAAVVVFPSGSLESNNKQAVQAIIMGEGSGITAKGTCVWYMSTIETGKRGRDDLEAALKAMEGSILRESSDLDTQDYFDNANGMLNSVKLGQSFKDFVPKEKIQYILKFYYIQFTSIPHAGVVNPNLYRKNSVHVEDDVDAPDRGVIYSSLPSSEISYDGIVTASKILYEKVVGSDDDFFDVDFEDDDDEGSIANNLESAIAEDDDDDEHIVEPGAAPVEFAEDMEL